MDAKQLVSDLEKIRQECSDKMTDLDEVDEGLGVIIEKMATFLIGFFAVSFSVWAGKKVIEELNEELKLTNEFRKRFKLRKRFISVTIKYTCLCKTTITAHRYIPGGNQPITCVKCGKTLKLVERKRSGR